MGMEITKISGLLPSNDYEAVIKLQEGIHHDFQVKPIFRTETECRISVLNDVHFPTPHSKYWQSIREQQVHFEELVWLDFEYRKKKIELRKLEKELEKEEDELERELKEIEIQRKRYEILICEKVGKERVREITQWQRIKDELLENHPEAIQTENADEGIYQLKSYTKTFILEFLNSGPNVAAADAQNIIGKAKTAIRRCRERGIWGDVKKEMNLNPSHLKALGE